MISLKLENVSKSFRKKQALKNVSCVFEPGITALLGPNGAGKSTLMNIICTLLRADSGSVLCNKEFCGVQMNCSIGMIFVAMWCGKVLNVICLVLFSECFARNKKNLKDAAVYAMLLVIALLFLKNALLNTPCYSVIQIGYVDWKQTLRDTVLLLPGGIPSMVLGITLSAIAAACLCFMFAEKNKVRH